MPHVRVVSGILLVLAVFWMAAPVAQAITDEEIFRQMQFNFINPGARALGLGGAFIAVADDATAAYANPAGLMQLAAPEFFVEERFIGGYDTTGEESNSSFTFSSTNERLAVSAPTFFSYVKPWKTLALGLSRQEEINTRVKTESIFDIQAFSNIRWFGEGDSSVDVTNWNASVAWRPVEWISFGATLTFAQFNIDSQVTNFISDPGGQLLCDTTGGGPFACGSGVPAALQNPQLWYQTSADDGDSDFTYSVGILYTPMDQFSVGFVFRQGADFEFTQDRTDGLSSSIAIEPDWSKPTDSFTQTFDLPDSYGLGFKWHPNQNWIVALDGVRISYSDLLDGLMIEQNILTAVVNPLTTGGGFATDFVLDDVTEVHLGAEYLFTQAKWPLSVRGGLWLDPDNVLRDQNGDFGAALAGRDNELHYTVGAGIVVQQKFQADVAVSLSEIGNEAVASFIFRF